MIRRIAVLACLGGAAYMPVALQAAPRPRTIVGTGIESLQGGSMSVVATDSPNPSGRVEFSIGDSNIVITLDCVSVEYSIFGGYGIGFIATASGVSPDGTRYYVRVQRDGDSGSAIPSARISTETAPNVRCGSPNGLSGYWFTGVYEATP